MTIELGNSSFIRLGWFNFNLYLDGLSFCIGWEPNIELAMFTLSLMEWREDGKEDYWGMTVLRFQVLYFWIYVSLNNT